MSGLLQLLRWFARHGRTVLVAGLAGAVALPEFALAMKPWLPELIALLLFIAALRIGPRQAAGSLQQLRMTLGLVGLYQVVMPCAFAIVFSLAGLSSPFATAIVLMAAACSIAGSPNLTLLTGNDPAPALRLLVAGTALLPFTVIPVFWLSPILGSPGEIAAASGRLMALIAAAALAAFAIRRHFLRDPAPATLEAIDGLSALAMAIVVVGLMSAIGPAVRSAPQQLLVTLAVAFAANFGLQLVAWAVLRPLAAGTDLAAQAIVAGNRNMALFLTALPASVTDPILLFIGCYQIPMYLTPILLGRLYSPPRQDGHRSNLRPD